MMKRSVFWGLWSFLAISIVFSACNRGSGDGMANGSGDSANQGPPQPGDWIRAFNSAEPDGLHPYATSQASAAYVKENIYLYLADLNPKTLEFEPTLAKALAMVSDDGLRFTYEMREEAAWDNGDPITGHDFAFSVKAVRNPLSAARHIRNYHSYIEDVIVDEGNPRRFTVVTGSPFFLAETAISSLEVISKNFYDPKGLLDNVKISDMGAREDSVAKLPEVIEFSENFNSDKYQRDPAFIYGPGPYRLESWTSGDNVTLVHKKDWWGDKLKGKTWFFSAYAEKLIFKTITDRSTLLPAAANGELDVLRDITPVDFTAARNDTNSAVYKNFKFEVMDSYAQIAMGINCRPPSGRVPVLEDKRVRRAMAHLLNVDNIIETVYEGYGTRMVGPISPHQKNEYNTNLKPIAFDPAKAAELLDEAGWIDSNGDGIRDKMIKGKKVPLKIELIISNTSKTAPTMGRLLADQAKKVGVVVDVNPIDFGTLVSRLQAHDFDMYGAGWTGTPLPTDLMQVWHTDSWVNKGSNYYGFGNAESDSLIEKIRTTLKAEDRKPLYWRFQEIVYDEQPMLFVMSSLERLIIHKRFRGVVPTVLRPGYKLIQFWVPKEEQMFKAQ